MCKTLFTGGRQTHDSDFQAGERLRRWWSCAEYLEERDRLQRCDVSIPGSFQLTAQREDLLCDECHWWGNLRSARAVWKIFQDQNSRKTRKKVSCGNFLTFVHRLSRIPSPQWMSRVTGECRHALKDVFASMEAQNWWRCFFYQRLCYCMCWYYLLRSVPVDSKDGNFQFFTFWSCALNCFNSSYNI